MTMMLRRFYHLSVVNYNIKKQGYKLCKLMNPSSQKKRYQVFNEASTLPSVKSLMKVKHEPGKRGIKRIAVLNKLFMKYITDIMATGSTAINIVGRGIEISKVKMSPDLQVVSVFWVSKGGAGDAETEAALARLAGPLRHELSTLRLMGEVPYISFVKDRQEARLVDLNRRLLQADYGDDFEPTSPGHLLRSDFTLDTSLSPEMKAKIKQLEDALPIEDQPLPEMTHTVFGLDHDRIMKRLLAARKRTREAWSTLSAEAEGAEDAAVRRAPADRTAQVDFREQRKLLADFLQKRQIEQLKIYKESRNRAWETMVDVQPRDATDATRSHDHDDPEYDHDDPEYDHDDFDDYYDDDTTRRDTDDRR